MDNYIRALAAFVRQPYALATSSIASGATVDVGLADAESVSITGTTTITSLGTGYVGCLRELRFAGALTLTNSANLILPGGSNLSVAAGDVGTFRCLAAGQWVCVAYSAQGSASAFLPLSGGAVTGATTFASTVAVAGTLGVTGAATFAGDLTANNIAAVGTLTVDTLPVGYRGIPSFVQNATYTYVATDAGKARRKTNTTAYTYTVPASVIGVDEIVVAINAGTAGNITLAAGAGMTLQLAGSATTGTRTIAPGGIASILFTSATTALVSGPGVT